MFTLSDTYKKIILVGVAGVVALVGHIFFQWSSTNNAIEKEADALILSETGVDAASMIDKLPTKS